MAVNYNYFSGAFQVTWAHAVLGTVDCGTTESGIRFGGVPSFSPIYEDRQGDTEVDALFMGMARVFCTFESQVWTSPIAGGVGGTLPLIRLASLWLSDTTFTAANFGDGLMGPGLIGTPIVAGGQGATRPSFAGTLTLTAVQGKLVGTTQAQVFTCPKAVPVGDWEFLLSVRRPIKIPLDFKLYPDPTEYASSGKLKYYDITDVAALT